MLTNSNTLYASTYWYMYVTKHTVCTYGFEDRMQFYFPFNVTNSVTHHFKFCSNVWILKVYSHVHAVMSLRRQSFVNRVPFCRSGL